MDALSEFGNITVAKGSIFSLAAASLVFIILPFVFWLVWAKTHRGSLKTKYLLVGAAGFIISSRVLETGLHMVCLVLDTPISRRINASAASYVLYGIVTAGLFEEVGRWIVLKYILKKDSTRENAVLYGIGHGGAEVLAVIVPSFISLLVIDIMFAKIEPAKLLPMLNITEETAALALPQIQAAAGYRFGDAGFAVAERLFTMFIHIGLTLIVFFGVKSGKMKYLWYAVLLHMAVDLVPAMYQKGLTGILLTEGWVLLWAVIITVLGIIAYKACGSREAPSPEVSFR